MIGIPEKLYLKFAVTRISSYLQKEDSKGSWKV